MTHCVPVARAAIPTTLSYNTFVHSLRLLKKTKHKQVKFEREHSAITTGQVRRKQRCNDC